MLVAISQRNEKHEVYGYRDILENNYINYYERFGLTLIPIPNSGKDIWVYFKKLQIEGIILTGGGDVNPQLYDQKPTYATNFSDLRDKTEKNLLEIAIDKDLPVFCNCRGFQFMNVFFGGDLTQKIEYHVNKIHKVDIVDRETYKFLNKKEFSVNSYHNQGIRPENISKELKPFAVRDKDKIVEGIYHPKYPIAGVQWHPERIGSDKSANEDLIKAFLNRKLFWGKN